MKKSARFLFCAFCVALGLSAPGHAQDEPPKQHAMPEIVSEEPPLDVGLKKRALQSVRMFSSMCLESIIHPDDVAYMLKKYYMLLPPEYAGFFLSQAGIQKNESGAETSPPPVWALTFPDGKYVMIWDRAAPSCYIIGQRNIDPDHVLPALKDAVSELNDDQKGFDIRLNPAARTNSETSAHIPYELSVGKLEFQGDLRINTQDVSATSLGFIYGVTPKTQP